MSKSRLTRWSALFMITALKLQAIWTMVIQNMPSQYVCTSPYYYLPFDDLPTTEKTELCGYLTDSILYRITGTDAVKCVGGVPTKVSGYTKYLSHALCLKQDTLITPSGPLVCPTNYRKVTKIEATNQNAQICAQLTQWAILLIGDGNTATPSIRGPSYSCVITDPDTAPISQVLCTRVVIQIISANESGCPASQIYVYSSSPTCRSSCGPPYTLQDEIYCNLVCDTSCATCSGSSSTQCLTCQSGLLMLPNHSCLSACPDGYYPTSTHCLPCDSTCKTCSGPLATDCILCKTNLNKSPNSVCETSTNANLPETASEIRNVTSKAYTTSSLVASALSLGSCGVLTSNIASEMFEYIKYINVTHSTDLELILILGQINFINFNLNINLPESIEDKMENFPVPKVLGKYGLVSNFFLNIWQSVFWWGVTILCISFLLSCELSINKKRKNLHFVLKKLRIMTQNFLLTLFYNVIGDIIFFGILEFQYNHNISGYNIISFTFAIICVIILIAVLAMHSLFLHKRQKRRASSQNKTELSPKYENVQMLFHDFKNDFIIQEGALFVIILREILFKVILVTLYPYPLIETILIVILGCLMIAYLLIIRPFESIFDAAQIILCELVLLIVNVGLLISAVSDRNHSSASIETVGRIIIILALIFNIEILAYSLIKILLTLTELIQSWRKRQTIKVLNRTLSSSSVMLSLPATGPLVSTQRDGLSRTREREIEINKTSDFIAISENYQNISGINMSTLQLSNEASIIYRLESIHTTPINVSRRNRFIPLYSNHQSSSLDMNNEPEKKRRAR